MESVILGKDRTLFDGTIGKKIHISAACDIGQGRKTNQDRVVIAADEETGRAAVGVVDGMGGKGDGGLAADIIGSQIDQTPGDVRGALQRSQMGLKMLPKDKEGTGACIMIDQFIEIGDHIGIETFQAGDVKRIIMERRSLLKRLWLALRRKHPPIQFTQSRDQTFAEDCIASGVPADEAKEHYYADRVTNSITAEQCEPTVSLDPDGSGMRVLLYSDGIGRNIPVEEMIELSICRTISALRDTVMKLAMDRMSDRAERKKKKLPVALDNISIVAIDVD